MPLLRQQLNCQPGSDRLPPWFLSFVTGRGDQGGWEEEVITTRPWGSTPGIIRAKTHAAPR